MWDFLNPEHNQKHITARSETNLLEMPRRID